MSKSETFFNYKKVKGVEFNIFICADMFDWANGKTFNGITFNFNSDGTPSISENEWKSKHANINLYPSSIFSRLLYDCVGESKTWSCTKNTFEILKEALKIANEEWVRETQAQHWHHFSQVREVDRYVVQSSEIENLRESYSEKEIEPIKYAIKQTFKYFPLTNK